VKSATEVGRNIKKKQSGYFIEKKKESHWTTVKGKKTTQRKERDCFFKGEKSKVGN